MTEVIRYFLLNLQYRHVTPTIYTVVLSCPEYVELVNYVAKKEFGNASGITKEISVQAVRQETV